LGEALIPILAIKAAKAQQTTESSPLIQPVESGFLDFFLYISQFGTMMKHASPRMVQNA
jgi:hypothetical protein